MKKLFMTIVAVAGAVLILWAGYIYFGAGKTNMKGFHPMYPALVGIALFTGGVIGRQD